MDAKQVNQAIEKIGLGPVALGRLLQTGRSTVYRWIHGGTEGCNAIVLRLLQSGKITQQDIVEAQD